MTYVSRFTASISALVLLAVISGCARSGPRAGVLVRVGASSITTAELSQWMAAAAPEHYVPDPPHYRTCVARKAALSVESITAELEEECQREYALLRQRAFAGLITANWLLAEARVRGAATREPPHNNTGVQLAGRPFATVATSGATVANLARRAGSAASHLYGLAVAGATGVTNAQIASYYIQHRPQFEHPEQRYFEIVERVPTRAEQQRAKREWAHGKTPRTRGTGIVHDWLTTPPNARPDPNGTMIDAILAAKPNVLVAGRALMDYEYGVFKVLRIIPHTTEPLAKVHQRIGQTLTGEHERHAVELFIAGWRATWTARTNCASGYIVQKCSQYHGRKAPEDLIAFD